MVCERITGSEIPQQMEYSLTGTSVFNAVTGCVNQQWRVQGFYEDRGAIDDFISGRCLWARWPHWMAFSSWCAGIEPGSARRTSAVRAVDLVGFESYFAIEKVISGVQRAGVC